MIPPRNPYLQLPFLICVGVLTVSAIGMKAAMHWADIQTKKYPLPLRKPLDQLDPKQLAPYQVIQQAKIDNLDVLESLGTRDYIQWILEDSQGPGLQPGPFLQLVYHLLHRRSGSCPPCSGRMLCRRRQYPEREPIL